jgi:hypothetical protein
VRKEAPGWRIEQLIQVINRKNENMKTTKTVLLVAAALTVAVGQRARATDPSSVTPTRKMWIQSGPRTLEEYPWLLRQSSAHDTTQARARADAVLVGIKKNKAFASSPRVREEFPKLNRPPQVTTEVVSRARVETDSNAELLKNQAWAKSPRVLEVYPWLANYDWDASKRNVGVIK